MKTIVHDNKEFKFYDTAKELPIIRWNSFLSFTIQSSELGPNFESCIHKLSRMEEHIKHNDKDAFNTERQNLQFQLFYIYKGINPISHALAQLLYSVDGKIIEDPTREDSYKLIENSNVFTLGLVEELVDSIRKK